jgi:murein DD-endopeptidase MepM/ murein hydrolase activator NlpD
VGWVDGKFLNFASGAPAPSPSATPTATAGPAQPNARFIWPVESRRISQSFSGRHAGIDIDEFPSGGNPVVATAAGTVTFAGGDACCSYGLHVIVKHADGYSSLYSHLSSIAVSEGQEVKQGGLLGKSGSTGFSTGAHLHFEIRKDGVSVDPLTLLTGPYSLEG